MEEHYEIFKSTEGDTLTRLRKAGYSLEFIRDDAINTFEDFKRAVCSDSCTDKVSLKADMKKLYKNHISHENLKKFLKMGEGGFEGDQLTDALRILPLNEDGSISVDDLIDCLYK